MRPTVQMFLVLVCFLLAVLFVWTWTSREPNAAIEQYSTDFSELVCTVIDRGERSSVSELKNITMYRPKLTQIDLNNSILTQNDSTASNPKPTQVASSVPSFTKPKLILFLKFPSFYELEGSVGLGAFRSCRRTCELTVNISRLNEADLVNVYSHNHIANKEHTITPVKPPGQIWVFFAVESPPFSTNSEFGKPEWDGLFNWTMTYRYDSEFWHGYIKTVRRNNPVDAATRVKNEKNWRDVFSKKTKMVAWIVSHCETDSRREAYVAELSMYIEVDIYGACGRLKCPDEGACMAMLRRDYKFYLSFENSLCKDYVTEKLRKIYDVGAVVPVVRGGADYQKLFPDNSVVDASNFDSPKSLALHLKALAENEDAYINLLQWTWNYEIIGPHFPLCQLCERLHEPQLVSCYYKNIYRWWSQNMCTRPDDF